jgi:hypothetical protein
MKLKGKRILLSRPVMEKSAIELTPEIQASLDINIGDVVYIPKNAIEQCDVLEVEGEVKLMVSDFQVAIVW